MVSKKRCFTSSEVLIFVEDSDDTESYYSSSKSELEDDKFASDSYDNDVTSEDNDDHEVGAPPANVWQTIETPATGFNYIPFSMNACGIQIEEAQMPTTVLG